MDKVENEKSFFLFWQAGDLVRPITILVHNETCTFAKSEIRPAPIEEDKDFIAKANQMKIWITGQAIQATSPLTFRPANCIIAFLRPMVAIIPLSTY